MFFDSYQFMSIHISQLIAQSGTHAAKVAAGESLANSDYAAALRYVIVHDQWDHDDTNSGVDSLLSLIEQRLNADKTHSA
jgi:hypothetical protein